MIDSAGVWPTHLLLGFLRFIVVGIGRRERPAVATDKPHLQAPFGRFKWRLLATPRACMRPHLKIAGVVQCQPNLCFLRLRPQPPPTPGPTTCCRHHKVRVCSAQYQDPFSEVWAKYFLFARQECKHLRNALLPHLLQAALCFGWGFASTTGTDTGWILSQS